MHRTVHRESVVQRVTQTQLAQTVVIQKLTSTLNSTSDASKFFADLWGEHKSLTDCQLFDQACPDALQNALHIDNYITAPAIWLGLVLLERFALFERFYAARGPPVRSLI
jgi:transcription termination factor NusB